MRDPWTRTLFQWNGSGEPDADALVGCRWPDAVEPCFSESSNCRYAQSLPTSRVSLRSRPVTVVRSRPRFEGVGSHGRPADGLHRHHFWSAFPATLKGESCRVVCCVCCAVVDGHWFQNSQSVVVKAGEGEGRVPRPGRTTSMAGERRSRAATTVSTFQLQGIRRRRSIEDCGRAARISAAASLGQMSNIIVGRPE